MRYRFLETSAADWSLSPRAARWIFWLPLVVTAALFATPLVYGALGSDGQWVVRRAFEVVMREDGPVEWAQVVCFASGCIAAGLIARGLLRSGHGRQGALFAVAALGLFVVVGEELSWGQRIFGVITPGWLADLNYQDELNAHNIRSVRELLDYALVLIAAWGVFGGWILRRRSIGPLPLAAPVFLIPSFGLTLGYELLRETLWSRPGFFLQLARYGEWPELGFAFGVGAFFVLGYRRLVRANQARLAFEHAENEPVDSAA